MEPFQLWKDEYRREVDEVLAERKRTRQSGGEPNDLSFEGSERLSDLVIPPVGLHAEVTTLRKRLGESEAVIADLKRGLDEARKELAQEAIRRDKLKEAAMNLSAQAHTARTDYELVKGQNKLLEEKIAFEMARAEESKKIADIATARLLQLEQELSKSRRAQEDAFMELRGMDQSLAECRTKINDLAEKLSAEKDKTQSVLRDAQNREADAMERFQAERGRLMAQMEEVQAKLRADFEEERSRLEEKLDAERKTIQDRWREQAEMIQKLRSSNVRKSES